MCRKQLSLLLLTVGVGCSDSAADYDAGGPVDAVMVDSHTVIDCDLVTNGCPNAQKCAFVVTQTDPTFAGGPECVPDGTVEAGGSCEWQPPLAEGGSGTDNCKAGLWCGDAGVCRPVCDGIQDLCDPSDACWTATYQQQPILGPWLGECVPNCDPVSQDCGGSLGCFVGLTVGAGRCVEPASGNTQGDVCTSIHDCAVGFGCSVLDQPAGSNVTCAAFCDPAAMTGAPTHCDTILGAGYECRVLADLWPEYSSDWVLIDNGVGVCVDPLIWP